MKDEKVSSLLVIDRHGNLGLVTDVIVRKVCINDFVTIGVT